ncbi:geranylgeranyl diphosphate synthase, type II [Arachidicoccus rhizosphaerae]|uniref:Geranylgeranyl diphosphate synthase, type II n=1 Tax=Arachidicoccus rhizosphaerae TaxID=551991 RepID=A0A1H3W8D6_9BACT|nr:polyprenyl synthetase family protein [Arachidicoccus rhizosphaerae]SDZ83250.1 geranylgeranyl diphosphate synthase, type II [Arachidicoccus rhizosphaerae]
MHSFKELIDLFCERFNQPQFPTAPAGLYEPASYFLGIGGKRIRPAACLMGNELFGDIKEDCWQIATAIELFHNFTLMHDDIMDKAALRRGQTTVHVRNGENTAILSGDVMLVQAYHCLEDISVEYQSWILKLFNQTAREVCEGQQYDMDYEAVKEVSLEDYIQMIKLKTSVLLAASLKMGAIVAGATVHNCDRVYSFGKNLGIAFQLQDDYLDCFGDPEKFGKQVGGDILRNKKTCLLIKAKELAGGPQKQALEDLLAFQPETEAQQEEKVKGVLDIYRKTGVQEVTRALIEQYAQKAMNHLDQVVVVSTRKQPLQQLAEYLLQRDY